MVDPAYLKRNIFAGESGGDYNALYGYANREAGPFQGVRVTDMTINEALQFADPSGPYAASVRGQVGRTATPMGAYQVVGSTLRDAVKGLGLTGNERFDEATQDRIAQWIYENQGPSAWEGWGGGGGGNVTKSSKGGTGMVGLLDMQGEEPQTFGQRLKSDWRSGDLMDRLALGFNSMRMNPDQGIAQVVSNRMAQRQEQRAGDKAANRTAAWLASIGREDLAGAMLSGGLDPKQAAQLAMTPPEDTRTAMIQNYEYWISQGKTPDEAAELARAGGGGSVTNLNMADESQGALNKEFAKAEGTSLAAAMAQGPRAASSLQDLTLLGEVLQYAPQDPVTGRLAEYFPGVSSAGAAAQSIIKRVAPTLRAEGSGATSDIEYSGMLQSLPSLQNYPEANAAILGMMKSKAAIDIERAQVVRDFANSGQTPQDAQAMRARLAEIDGRSIMTPELQRVISALNSIPAPADGGGTTGAPPAVIRYDENGNRMP